MSTYKIIVRGNILPGFEQELVKDNIARLFKLADPEQRDKVFARIFSGKPMVFKKGLTQEKAKAYEAAMARAGLGCEIVSEAPASGMELESASITATENKEQPTNDTRNPEAETRADLETPAAESQFVLVEPQKIAISGGIEWIKEGFHFFKQAPLVWVLMVLVFMVISIVLSLIPFASLALNIINPVFIGGFMIACYKLTQNEEITVSDLFAGFKNKFGRLAAVGGIYLLLFIVIGAVSVALMLSIMGQDKVVAVMKAQNPALFLANFSIFFLVFFGLMMLVLMAYYFAPALVVMHDVTAVEAMKLSFKGCLRNMLPFLLYSVVVLVLGIIAMIPLGLGYLVLMPVITASIFVAYRQIFTEVAIQ
jgi:uncharacterized membrane protein